MVRTPLCTCFTDKNYRLNKACLQFICQVTLLPLGQNLLSLWFQVNEVLLIPWLGKPGSGLLHWSQIQTRKHILCTDTDQCALYSNMSCLVYQKIYLLQKFLLLLDCVPDLETEVYYKLLLNNAKSLFQTTVVYEHHIQHCIKYSGHDIKLH